MEMRRPAAIPVMVRHDLNCNVQRSFKSKKSFESRKDEVHAIRVKFPTKVPIIVERNIRERNLPEMSKTKFLVPQEVTMSQFLTIIRNRMNIKQSHAIYLLINNKTLISMSRTIAEVYQDYRDEDGFLYMTYASKEVYG